jgi:hypothetical protein
MPIGIYINRTKPRLWTVYSDKSFGAFMFNINASDVSNIKEFDEIEYDINDDNGITVKKILGRKVIDV